MHLSLTALTLAASALAATIPSEPWSTLTPDATPLGKTTDYSHKFGIQIVTLSGSYSVDGDKHKRAINQIGDGQIQEQTSVTVSVPATTTEASIINQIGDGQIQHQTTTTAKVINQIGDGQIQHQTSTTSSATTAKVINQIGDGQIQHQTSTTSSATASVVNQIGDGQIQHQTSTTTTAAAASQISDGQVQASASASASASSDDDSGLPLACMTSDSLVMTLNNTQLRDGKGRVGAIVANRQFQFDGPPPQSGSIYAAGWSITDDGLLALGNSAIFYQCKSGDFYNLYDENVAAQCEPVHLSVIDLVEC